jgi:hypothetical protein
MPWPRTVSVIRVMLSLFFDALSCSKACCFHKVSKQLLLMYLVEEIYKPVVGRRPLTPEFGTLIAFEQVDKFDLYNLLNSVHYRFSYCYMFFVVTIQENKRVDGVGACDSLHGLSSEHLPLSKEENTSPMYTQGL